MLDAVDYRNAYFEVYARLSLYLPSVIELLEEVSTNMGEHRKVWGNQAASWFVSC